MEAAGQVSENVLQRSVLQQWEVGAGSRFSKTLAYVSVTRSKYLRFHIGPKTQSGSEASSAHLFLSGYLQNCRIVTEQFWVQTHIVHILPML